MPITTSTKGGVDYVLGHAPGELQRLMAQSQFWGEHTLEVLVRAGISRGMRVLDLGTGAGDVALLAASLVGETGSVLGIDRAEASVDAATRRASEMGVMNVRFELGAVENPDLDGKFDAVVGRLILLYLPDPAAAIAAIVRRSLNPGALAAFMEFDMESARQVPPVPLVTAASTWIRETFRRAGNPITLGPRLPQLFRAAGLPDPQTIGRVMMQAPPAYECTRYTTATIRSLLPMIEKYGVANADEIGIDTLAERMQQALVEANATMIMPTLVGAWARVPG
jgi:ubiquinone/menaquinone biosynthesis C-methylase UbiE